MTTLVVGEEIELGETAPLVPRTQKPKLTRLMELVGSVPKDKTNDFHHYRYQSAEAILERVRAGMIELGLYSEPHFEIVGTEGDLVTVKVKLVVFDSDPVGGATTHGGIGGVMAFGSGSDKGDKAVMKAQTAAIKYAWKMLLNISTGDDPEADTATDARVAPNVSQPESKGNSGAIGVYENAKVTEVRTPTGKGPHIIVTDKGQLNTFDKDIIAQAGLAQASGLLTRFVYKETKWGKDVVKEKANGERTDG